jgi:hypothetical protein
MGFAPHQLRDKALAALEEAAARAAARPVERSRALGFALAYLWAHAGGSRAPFVQLWQAFAIENDIARSQNVVAALNAVRRAVGAG